MSETDPRKIVNGPILSLDLGEKNVGVAISDELLITIKRLDPLKRSNWKKLLLDVKELIEQFNAQSLLLGLPLRLDGTSGDAADNAKQLGRNFSLSLTIPVYFQDERLTSFEAKASLLSEGRKPEEVGELIDSEAAALILRDFITAHSDERKILKPYS